MCLYIVLKVETSTRGVGLGFRVLEALEWRIIGVCSYLKKATHCTLARCMVFTHNVGLWCMWKGWSRWSSCCKDGTQEIHGFSVTQRNTLIMFRVHVGMEVGIVDLHVYTIYAYACDMKLWRSHWRREFWWGFTPHYYCKKTICSYSLYLTIASPLGCWLVNNINHVGFLQKTHKCRAYIDDMQSGIFKG